METVVLNNDSEIESYLRKNVYLHLYSIGDLDPFYRKYTTWYGLKENGTLKAVILLYSRSRIPTLLVLSENSEPIARLFNSIEDDLPDMFYAHISPGLDQFLTGKFTLTSEGKHVKMALVKPNIHMTSSHSNVCRMTYNDLDDIRQLYTVSYPENWFDDRMLETGQYYGLRKNRELISIAGVHVFSNKYRVAALGNITTHPDHRGNGYGKMVTAKVCDSLLKYVDHIGLNVYTDNSVAISLYQKLGFEAIGSYFEYTVTRK